jgi:hypothetical protein
MTYVLTYSPCDLDSLGKRDPSWGHGGGGGTHWVCAVFE